MKILKSTWVLLLVVPMQFLQASTGSDSAEVKNVLCFGIRGHYGFIIPHSKQIKELFTSSLIELTYYNLLIYFK